MEYLREEEPELPKILFTGLDTAGKTSIILALQREFSKIANITPTRGAQRRIFTFFGRKISEWDLGGQVSYRISYLKNPTKYFEGTEIAIYVIDIQDQTRIKESLSYLKDVVEQFRELNINPPINVFFHKLDPVLKQNYQDEISNLIVDLILKIKHLANYQKIQFFQTSIYDLPTIINAMSKIFLDLYPKTRLIEKTVEEFASKLNSEGLIVIDNNSLVVGSYYADEETKNILMKSVPLFMALNDSLRENTPGLPEDQIVASRFGRYLLFKQIMLEESVIPYHILLIRSDNPWNLQISSEGYNEFFRMMKALFYK